MTKATVSIIAAIVAAAAMPVLAADFALAKPRDGKSASRTVVTAVPFDSAARVRADSRDPGGDYRGYPDWARFALGSSRAGNSR